MNLLGIKLMRIIIKHKHTAREIWVNGIFIGELLEVDGYSTIKAFIGNLLEQFGATYVIVNE